MNSIKHLLIFCLICSGTLTQADSCPQGQTFDTGLNRCILKTDTVETKTQARNCEGLEGDAFKQCFHDNVDEQAAETGTKASKDPKKKLAVPVIVALGSAYILFMNKEALGQCSSTSTYLMGAGSAGTIIGEMLAINSYKKDTKNLKQKYNDRMTEQEKAAEEGKIIDSITENQKIAFDFQIAQEKSRKKAHKARKTTYTIAAGLYAASAIAAIYEGITSTVPPCNFKGSVVSNQNKNFINTESLLLSGGISNDGYLPKRLTFAEFQELVLRKIYNAILPSAYADGGATASVSSVLSGIKGYAKTASNAINKAIKHPGTRAAISGVLSGYSFKLSKDASDHAKEADRRIKALEELKASFVDNGGAGFSDCSADDRDNKSKPGCFCFDSAGNLDESKQGIKVCSDLLKAGADITGGEFGVNFDTENNGLKGCVDNKKKFDPTCECKKKKDKKDSKKNSCLKFSGKVNLGGLNRLTGLRGLVNDAVNFNRGNISTSDLGGSVNGVSNLIKKIDKQKAKLAKTKKFGPKIKKVNQLEGKLRRSLAKSVRRGLANGSIKAPAFGGGLFKGGSSDKKSLLKDVKETIKAKKPQFKKGGSLARGAKGRSANDYDFGDSGSGDGVDIEDVEDIMQKEYSFNDINDNSNNNLFQIISVRYQRSGLRSLFDDQGVSQADEANSSDINEK